MSTTVYPMDRRMRHLRHRQLVSSAGVSYLLTKMISILLSRKIRSRLAGDPISQLRVLSFELASTVCVVRDTAILSGLIKRVRETQSVVNDGTLTDMLVAKAQNLVGLLSFKWWLRLDARIIALFIKECRCRGVNKARNYKVFVVVGASTSQCIC